MSNKTKAIFAQLTKVDEANRTITGRITCETPDHANEVCDYASTKPLIEEWSMNVAKASGGKSVGNVRVMHGLTAAGKLTDIVFDDVNKAIDATAKIVDDAEWKKVMEGVYTGFSLGGSYVRKWDDGGFKRYTAKPSEVSIVDMPCNPDSTFTVQKADGSEELRKFMVSGSGEGSDVSAVTPVVYPESLTSEQVSKLLKACGIEANDEMLAELADVKPERLLKALAILRKKDDEKVNKIATACEGMSKALGRSDLKKGLWDVKTLTNVLADLDYVTMCATSEAAYEGDGSAVPGELASALADLGSILVDMVTEEVAELLKPYAADDAEVTDVMILELAAKPDGLQKLAQVVVDLRKAVVAGTVAKGADTTGVPSPATVTGGEEELRKSLDGALNAVKLAKGLVDETTTALRKAIEANKEQGERIATLEATVATLAKAIPVGDGPRLRMVNKDGTTEDVGKVDGAAVEPVRKADGSEDPVATAIKKAHASGPVGRR